MQLMLRGKKEDRRVCERRRKMCNFDDKFLWKIVDIYNLNAFKIIEENQIKFNSN